MKNREIKAKIVLKNKYIPKQHILKQICKLIVHLFLP